jgi:hypothetical protein
MKYSNLALIGFIASCGVAAPAIFKRGMPGLPILPEHIGTHGQEYNLPILPGNIGTPYGQEYNLPILPGHIGTPYGQEYNLPILPEYIGTSEAQEYNSPGVGGFYHLSAYENYDPSAGHGHPSTDGYRPAGYHPQDNQHPVPGIGGIGTGGSFDHPAGLSMRQAQRTPVKKWKPPKERRVRRRPIEDHVTNAVLLAELESLRLTPDERQQADRSANARARVLKRERQRIRRAIVGHYKEKRKWGEYSELIRKSRNYQPDHDDHFSHEDLGVQVHYASASPTSFASGPELDGQIQNFGEYS